MWPESQRDAHLGSVIAGGLAWAQERGHRGHSVLGGVPVPLEAPVPLSLSIFPAPSSMEGAQGLESRLPAELPSPVPITMKRQLRQPSGRPLPREGD